MQIVIDIPERTFESVKRYYEQNQECYALCAYVANGTPLPKGHGRLIDADILIKQYHEYCKENCIYTENERNVMCRACETGYAIETLENAPTVLPATKEGVKEPPVWDENGELTEYGERERDRILFEEEEGDQG